MEKLALGAVQLGLPYGAANQTGMPSNESATAIIQLAVTSSVPFVDTAAICELRLHIRLSLPTLSDRLDVVGTPLAMR